MKNEIIDILQKSNFSDDFIHCIQENFPDEYRKKYEQPFHQKFSENELLSFDAKERVIESLAQLVELKEFYIDKTIPLFHFYKSVYDLNYRIERYYRNEGSYGLTDRDLKWLSPLYKGDIFDLGSLRFQISGFSYQEIERQTYQCMSLAQKWKERFPEGTPIITIHILKNTDFQPEKIDESLAIARNFFAKHFPEHDYEVFICRTWLLYRPTRDILATDSNIASFSNRFQIIAENQNTKQALDRIYGTNDLDTIEKMEKVSSLEKTAYQALDKLGVAAGFIQK